MKRPYRKLLPLRHPLSKAQPLNGLALYLHQAEKILTAHTHAPKALKELRSALLRACPEPKRVSSN